ncbi:MAG: 2-amino-4-hydroxy-6-hydroxymethyldihydropteridine pyrophosphokinase [Firmicutes bacterium]|nr:2-amino-4-hydroxy-6-hydroxymethyldihydropteridine pyrophosphokinase [Bacillota bacterium]
MIVLGLGSNIGDRKKNIQAAIRAIHSHPNIRVIKMSSFYETDPVGYIDQPCFINAVAAVATTLSPLELLEVCLSIEQNLGRIRVQKWGPRTIDIDLLIFDEYECNTSTLTLPHPRLLERGFVLVPLEEIASGQRVVGNRTPAELLAGIDTQGVRLYRQSAGEEIH